MSLVLVSRGACSRVVCGDVVIRWSQFRYEQKERQAEILVNAT